MKMKKVISLFAAAAMCVSLAACGNTGSTTSSAPSTNSSAPSTESQSGGAEVSLPKNIELQVPASAGGGTDVAVRALTSYINTHSDTNMTVVNNTDGGGVVAFETVRTAKADATKLLFFHTTMCIKTATGVYDHSAAEDFKVIAVNESSEKGGYVLVVNSNSGITTLDEFIAAAKEKNGAMMIGVETGGSSHIMAGMLATGLGIELNYVEAGPDTEKLTALVGGSIDCALVNGNQAKQYLESDMVNGLGCFSSSEEGGRTSTCPDVPSFIEQGYDLVYGTTMFVLGPKDLDDATAEAIRDLFFAATEDADTQKILEGAGLGMTIVPYADGAGIVSSRQESLNKACADLGLAG